jgi:hypothetical protein
MLPVSLQRDNPEKLATYGTHDTGQINVREYRRGNAKGQSRETFVRCLVYPMLPVSLDCPFALPLRYVLTFICPVSCVPYVASFSGLSLFITPSVLILGNQTEKSKSSK